LAQRFRLNRGISHNKAIMPMKGKGSDEVPPPALAVATDGALVGSTGAITKGSVMSRPMTLTPAGISK